MFSKAQKQKSKLRLLFEGPAGSGKTYSSLIAARAMGDKVAVIDTEKGSASLYSDIFEFDVCELSPPYTPESYIEAINEAQDSGYDVIVLDSISHEWAGEGGCLDIQSSLGGRYQDWSRVTPRHEKFKESILQSNCHIVATARTKTDYAVTTENGRTKIEKLGTKTEQREGLDFEFTTVLRINQGHMFTSSKDRTGIFEDKDAIFSDIHGELLSDWLGRGVDLKEEHEKHIAACQSIEELQIQWSKVPKKYKALLADKKDEKKQYLLSANEDNLEVKDEKGEE